MRHFHQLARRDHGVTFSYTLVKTALQGAGLVRQGPRPGPPSAAARAPPVLRRTAAPRRQSPPLARPRPGRVAHPAGRRRRCDEAGALCPARGRAARATRAIMTALVGPCSTRHGLPGALYTDRAHWAVHTPTSGSAPGSHAPDPGGPRAAGPRHRTHPRPLAAGPRAQRARQPHPARSAGQRAPASPGSGPSRPPIATSSSGSSPRTTRPSAARPTDPAVGLRPRHPGAARAHPLPRRGARRRPRQHRDPGSRRPAARQAARPPHLRRPAGPRAPPSRWPPLRLVGAALPGPLRCRRAARSPLRPATASA